MKLVRLLRTANTARLATLLVALWKLFQHPETPRTAKFVAVFVLAYAVSPIDLVPDFIPVLGQLDDIIIVPLGITLAMKLTPPHLWQACLAEAEGSSDAVPHLLWGAALVVLVWALAVGGLLWWLVASGTLAW